MGNPLALKSSLPTLLLTLVAAFAGAATDRGPSSSAGRPDVPTRQPGDGLWVDWMTPLSGGSGYSGLDIAVETKPGRATKLPDRGPGTRPGGVAEPHVLALLAAGALPGLGLAFRRRRTR